LVKAILPTLLTELSTAGAAGYDMTESFLTTMREFLLAEAQECYWQQAVLRELSLVLSWKKLISVQRGRTRMV
jgi:programmed cell death 6-interacting protein